MASSLSEQIRQLVEQYADDVAPIVQAGDPVLRSTAQRYDGQIEQADLLALVELMRRTMHAAPGVGLAAPQIGIPLQLAVLEDPAGVSEEVATARGRYPMPFLTMVNARYAATTNKTAGFYEGCLSVTGYQAVVRRHIDIVAHFTDLDGTARREEFTGWPARIVQHEIDHLDGSLYLDRAEIRSLTTNQSYADRWAEPFPTAAAEELQFALD